MDINDTWLECLAYRYIQKNFGWLSINYKVFSLILGKEKNWDLISIKIKTKMLGFLEIISKNKKKNFKI